jgi:hypothetical protein
MMRQTTIELKGRLTYSAIGVVLFLEEQVHDVIGSKYG